MWRSAIFVLVSVTLGSCVEKDTELHTRGRRPLTPAERRRVKQNILETAPATMRFKLNANLGNKVTYLGLHTPQESVTPGRPFTLIHYFQVKKTMPGWKLFVHTNGPKQSDFRNFDHHPIHGHYPVSKWKAGEIIRDQHTITLPKNTVYKTVDIYVGIWRGRRRLQVLTGKHDGKNRLLAARLPVGRKAARIKPKPKIHPAPTYTVMRAKGKITIDGKPNEAAWAAASFTRDFVDSLTGRRRSPQTRAKLLYDDKFLYVFFSAVDDDVWASVKKADQTTMWTEQAFEVFIDANRDKQSYIELQVNPLGAILDSWFPRPGQSHIDWKSGLQAKVIVDGTLNKRTDKDRGWQAELAIPLTAVAGRGTAKIQIPPKPGDRWRINLFRTDRPKKGPLQAWAWSAPHRGTFHTPDRFGELLFAGPKTKAKPKPKPPAMPAAMRPAPRRATPMAPGGMR